MKDGEGFTKCGNWRSPPIEPVDLRSGKCDKCARPQSRMFQMKYTLYCFDHRQLDQEMS